MKKIFLGIILVSVLLLFGCIEQDQNKEKEELILSSLEKQANLTNTYQILYSETVQGIDLDIEIVKDNTEAVITDSEIDKKWIFFKNKSNFICEQRVDENILCTNVTNDTRFDTEINSAKTRFINEQITQDAKKVFNILINEKILDFKTDIINKTISGRNCKQVEFQINYQNLSIGGLTQLGLTSTNPLINKYKNFTQTLCYDEIYGIPLYMKLTYIDEGNEVVFERKMINFSENVTSSKLELPNETVEMTEFYTYFALARTELNTIVNCKNSDTSDVCFKQRAYDLKTSRLCEYIQDTTKRYQCLIIALTYDKNPELCEKIETEEDRDACYMELTRNTANKTYCDYIVNDITESLCLGLDTSLPENIVECEKDEDCTIQGCNHEVCAPINENITTTCEWKNIYSCYGENKTACKCVDDACVWEVTKELIDCIDEFESAETIADIQEKLGDETNQTSTETEE